MKIEQLAKALAESIAALAADTNLQKLADPKQCRAIIANKRCDYSVDYDPDTQLIIIKGGDKRRLRYRYELTVAEFVMFIEAIKIFTNMVRIGGALKGVIEGILSAATTLSEEIPAPDTDNPGTTDPNTPDNPPEDTSSGTENDTENKKDAE